MPMIYVARSAALSKWGADVGISKHLFKVGCTEEPVKPLVAAGWAGETDWTLVRQKDAEGVDEAEMLGRLAKKEKAIEPALYPKLRGAVGIFKVLPAHVESHIVVARALAGEAERVAIRLKPSDFADYLIKNALR
jgi:hypothetical protein